MFHSIANRLLELVLKICLWLSFDVMLNFKVNFSSYRWLTSNTNGYKVKIGKLLKTVFKRKPIEPREGKNKFQKYLCSGSQARQRNAYISTYQVHTPSFLLRLTFSKVSGGNT